MAAFTVFDLPIVTVVSTHSHPKVAAFLIDDEWSLAIVSTHSHPKVAAPYIKKQEKSAN